ncbi:hypothetical protein [Apilactobacillus ozensis]|nr:hypothetical protein [Apilactobacillus ozensis]
MNIDMQLKNTLTLEAEQGPFISLFINFNKIQDNLEFNQFIAKIKDRFTAKYGETYWNKYYKKLKHFNYSREKNVSDSKSIAVYVSYDSIHLFNLNHAVKTSATIASTMCIIPLIKDITDECYYKMLVLKDNDFKMYTVHNDKYEELKIPNAPALAFTNNKKDFFKLIDESILEKLNNDDTIPLVVVGSQNDCELYSANSKYNNLISDINISYQDYPSINYIVEHVNYQLYQKFIKNLRFNYNKAVNKSKVLTETKEIAGAAISGYIDTLIISDNDTISSQINDLAITTMGFGGDVYLIDKDNMPNDCELIAINRL